MKSGLLILCVVWGLLIFSAGTAQRKWRNAWEKAWQQAASCRDSNAVFSCLQQYGFADSLHTYEWAVKVGRTAKAETNMQLNGKDLNLGTDFFPLPCSGEGDWDASVLAGIQELNKPWLVNLQALYTSDSLTDTLQVMYVSARQAEQNGAQAWIAYGKLPEKWMQICDSTRFPRLSIPVIYLQYVMLQDGQSVRSTAHIRMKDSLLTTSLTAVCKQSSSPVLYIICRKGDLQACWLGMLSYAFLNRTTQTPVSLCVIGIPDHFPPVFSKTLAECLLSKNESAVPPILEISTDATISHPHVYICSQEAYWQSLLQSAFSNKWNISRQSCEALFQQMPAQIPIAHLQIPVVSASLSKEELSMHQQVYQFIRQMAEAKRSIEH
ncbi:hypothetical protein [Thermoflavifilum thermophilum]|uniref:Uncharacterized protein n=1 Tax=Thermoflavifilum thermophilum TaxID=1393122 RepID=A0A1I7NA18_9BACT|nr:hypothetical protein [Thermoflavifilum thermophilum]SFV31423.1 hypothetical protein SAMN05660895_1069 [Thermoflavifilum thermophilum]